MSDSDTQTPFERRLLDDLLAFRDGLPDPPPAPARAGRLIPTRRLALVLAGAALLAAAAGVFIFAAGGNGRTGVSVPQNAKQLKQRLLLALSSSDDEILYEFTQKESVLDDGSGPGTVVLQGHTDAWEDLSSHRNRTVTYDANGQITAELASSTTDNVFRTDFVIYQAQLWQTESHTLPGAGPNEGGSQGLADGYRNDVASGFFTLVGTDTIDGVAVLDLRRHQGLPPLPAGFPAPMPSTFDIWVDASTYLPVREEIHQGSTLTAITTYKWLPRTPANLANLDLVVPPGFRHITGSGGGTVVTGSGSITVTGGSTSLGGTSSGSSSSGLPAAPAGPPAAPYSGSGFVHQAAESPSGREDTWTDLTTGRVLETVTDPNGDITSEAASSVSDRTIRFDTVDFASRTWTTDYRDYTVTSFMPTGTAPGADPSAAGLQTDVALTRLNISQGWYTLVGKETIDGEPALHYRRQAPGRSRSVTFDMWFDASTYLPLRAVTTSGGLVTQTETWDWNVPASIGSQKVVFAEPPGFTHTVTHTVH